MVVMVYVDTLSLKFEKDPFSGCGEINVLLDLWNFLCIFRHHPNLRLQMPQSTDNFDKHIITDFVDI